MNYFSIQGFLSIAILFFLEFHFNRAIPKYFSEIIDCYETQEVLLVTNSNFRLLSMTQS